MPGGKPAGVRCVQLSADDCCLLFGRPERPSVCAGFSAVPDTCGTNRHEALAILARLEILTR
jgi:hypothetical protein